jgi:peptidoglycan/LPS O-acetylase OafA/YrhL
MANRRVLLTCATAILAVAAIPLSFEGPRTLRLAVVGLFLLMGPGSALVLLLKLNRTPARSNNLLTPLLGSIALGSSVAISILVSTAMVYAHLWNPSWAVAGMAAGTLVLLAVAAIRNRRRATPSPK